MSINIPGDSWLLTAEFVRKDHDLILVGADGKEILLKDYYINPQDLVTDTGAIIQAELAMNLAGPLAPGQYASTELPQGQESIGRIDAVEGMVEAIRVSGIRVELKSGDDVFQGDVIVTKDKGSVGITFVDDTIFSLGENGRMVLDEMIYDPTEQTGKFGLNLVQGVFSFVSGNIAKMGVDSMTVTTPVATIGIRGTKVVGQAAQEGSVNTLSLLPENINGMQIIGEVTVSNQAGSSVLNTMGATLSVSSSFQAPPPPVQMSQDQIQQKFGAALTTLSTASTNKAKVETRQAEEKAVEAEQKAEEAVAEADEAKAEAETAKEEAEEAVAEAEASGDEAAVAEAEAALAEAETMVAEAETKAEEAEAVVAEAEQAQEAVQEAQQVLETATQELQTQTKAAEAAAPPEAAPEPEPEPEAPVEAEPESKPEAPVESEPEASSEAPVDEVPIDAPVDEVPVDAPVETAPESVPESVPQSAPEAPPPPAPEAPMSFAPPPSAPEAPMSFAPPPPPPVSVLKETVVKEVVIEKAPPPPPPMIMDVIVTYEVLVSTQNGEEIHTSTTYVDSLTTTDDLENSRVVNVDTRTYTDTFETPVLETTTTTDIITFIWSDGWTEDMRGMTHVDTIQIDTIFREDEYEEVNTTIIAEPTTYDVTSTDTNVVDTDGGIDVVRASVGTYALPEEIENLIFLDQLDSNVSAPGLEAEYYTGTYLGNYAGKTPYKQTIDDNLNFYGIWRDTDGDNNLPYGGGHQNSHFTVRWQGEITAPTTGWVNFYSSHDDGARMMIDDQYVFNNWRLQGSWNYNSRGSAYMEEGETYSFQAEMYEHGGGDVMRLFWQYDNSNIHIVPAGSFSHLTSETQEYAGYGNDYNNTMQGNDNGGTLYGYGGDDTLIGGAGVDNLYGGDGSDTFVFDLESTNEDTIMDWMIDDKIDFSGMVPSTTYIGEEKFSGTLGEVRFNSNTKQLELDADADSQSNLNVNVDSYSTVTANDFNNDVFV